MTEVESSVSYEKPEKNSVSESTSSENITTDLESDNIVENNSESVYANVISLQKNNENITPVEQRTQRKRLALIDSDSEDDIVSGTDLEILNEKQTHVDIKNQDEHESVFQINVKASKKRLTLIDSDSEDDVNNDSVSKVYENDDNITLNDGHVNEKINKSGRKRLTLLDSDSESEENNLATKPTENNIYDDDKNEDATSNDKQTEKKKSRLLQLYDSDSEDEIKSKAPSEKSTTIIFETDQDIENRQTISRLRTICDSESSAEETEEATEHLSTENIIKQKRIKKNAEPTVNKMTGKEAVEQRRQIKSESQKMARETRVYLPYHRPKQHSLQEFLKRRSLMSPTVKAPPNTPTCLTIKMLNKNLKTTEHKLKQREKEIEEFYKSESEAEEEPEPEPAKNVETGNEIDKDPNENNEAPSDEISDNKIETEAEQSEEMDIVSEEQQKTQQEEIQEVASETKSSEDTAEENKSDEKTSEEQQVDQMEVDNTEQSSNDGLSEEINDETNDLTESLPEKIVEIPDLDKIEDKLKESEQNTDEFASDLDESYEEDKEAKLKELRDILEKNLTSSEPVISLSTDNNEEILDSESTEIIEQSEVKATQIVEDKDEKQKKLLEIEEKLKKLNPIIALKGNLQPRLSGGPNELIVLDDDIEKSKRVTNLMQRFLKHTAKQTVHKKSEISILNVEGGIINKETIPLTEDPDADDEPAKKIQIPGIKMKKLKVELQDQIIKKRLEEWKKRQEEMKLDNEEYDATYAGEKEDCGQLSNKMLDNDDEEEFTDSSSESEEEEEEDDIEIKEKPRVKSAFVDEEAEDSDEDEHAEALEDNEDNEEDEEENEDEDDDSDDPEDEESNTEVAIKKPLRRIIKPTEDSDEEISSRPGSPGDVQKKLDIETSAELLSQTPRRNATWDDNDDDIPAYQMPSDGLEKTPCKFATQNKNDLTTVLTPTLHLTALQGMNSATKSLQDSPPSNTFILPDPSPLKSNPFRKTKLFTDHESVEDNNLDELENLCSGKFVTQVNNKKDNSNDNFSTQENDLFNICSGDFSGFTQKELSPAELSLPIKSTQSLDLLNNVDSQNFKLTIESEVTTVSLNNEENKTTVSKFPKMVIASSSEDEDKENESPKKKKLKKKKRKYIIDDISITDDDELEHDRLQELDLEDEEESTRNVDYDSEENEIEHEEDEEMDEAEKPARKASDFFEAEAELSESEWGSADEDEKNLDDYEVEEGDAEKINEKKVQRELERMHMRNVLDDDQRDVQMLQELLLEDGELHGSGRERKFRWKNAESLSWNTDADKPKEEEEECEELESELQWRKMRHERETFLQEQQIKKISHAEEEELMNDSQIMKLGQKALKKFSIGSQNSSQKKTPVAEALSKSDEIKLPFTLAVKRGSFLQRSETTLARLAEITRVTGNLGGPKNSKNFVFTSVEKTDIVEEEVNIKKRKAVDGTPKVLKKLRIADMSPNVQKRKKKLNLT